MGVRESVLGEPMIVCDVHPRFPLWTQRNESGEEVVTCSACHKILWTMHATAKEYREFHLKVQKVSDEVEAINLIEQVFQIYPKVDRVAIATYFQRRMVAE